MNKKIDIQKNLSLLLPALVILLEVIVIVVLVTLGYEITQFLLFFFILLGIFLIAQIGQQLYTRWRLKQAIQKLDHAQELLESGQPLEAIKLWKRLLLSLPRDKYLVVLSKMKAVYQDQNMTEAVQQVSAVHSESKKFFSMTQDVKKVTHKDRRAWQNQAYKLRKMINALPEKKDPDRTPQT